MTRHRIVGLALLGSSVWACTAGDLGSDVASIDGMPVQLGVGFALPVASFQVYLYDDDVVADCGLPLPPTRLGFHIPSEVGDYDLALDGAGSDDDVVSNAFFVSDRMGRTPATAGRVSVYEVTPSLVSGRVELWVVGDPGNRVLSDFSARVCQPCDLCTGATPACDPVTNSCVPCTPATEELYCSAPSPRCSGNTCVECVADSDCPDAEESRCVANQCVECASDNDCPAAASPRCEASACVPCATSEDCQRLSATPICDAALCVECTLADASRCADYSCNPAARTCTTTLLGSRGECQTCVADADCQGYDAAEPLLRCVSMQFAGATRPDAYCLRRASIDCASPFLVNTEPRASLSGAAPETYCGMNEDVTTCEALLDFTTPRACVTDADCGCPRDAAGVCAVPGQGGICAVGCDLTCYCGYACIDNSECPGNECATQAPRLCQ